MALVNFNLDTPVFVPTEKTDFFKLRQIRVLSNTSICIVSYVSIYQNTYSRKTLEDVCALLDADKCIFNSKLDKEKTNVL